MKRPLAASVLALSLLLPPAVAPADGPSPERKAAEELLLLLQVDRNLDTMLQGLGKAGLPPLPEGAVPPEKAAEARAAAEKVMARMAELLRREMGWEKMKERYIDVYAATFTEAELRELAAFYRTPIGRKYVEKTPLLMEKSMAIGREATQRLLPEIGRMAEEAAREAKEGKIGPAGDGK